MSPLRPFSNDIWTVFQPLTFFGMRMGTRSTIVRLPSNALVIISPVRFDDATKDAIDALGTVTHIIAPNLFHHLFFHHACSLWPDATHLIPPGLSKKVDIVESATELTEAGSLQDCLFWHRIQGVPLINEHVFVAKPHSTLIITDLALNLRDHEQLWLRIAMRLAGAYDRFGPSLIERLAIRDRQAFGESLERLLSYQWDAIALPHGDLIHEGGRALFEEAFASYRPSVKRLP